MKNVTCSGTPAAVCFTWQFGCECCNHFQLLFTKNAISFTSSSTSTYRFWVCSPWVKLCSHSPVSAVPSSVVVCLEWWGGNIDTKYQLRIHWMVSSMWIGWLRVRRVVPNGWVMVLASPPNHSGWAQGCAKDASLPCLALYWHNWLWNAILT